MEDKIENLMLEHLKRFQATLDRVENKIGELTTRTANLESGIASITQHLAHHASTIAAQQVAMDRTNDRLDRIERCLELAS